MRKPKFRPAQFIRILRETETGKLIPEICQEHWLTKATLYRWQSFHSGVESSKS